MLVFCIEEIEMRGLEEIGIYKEQAAEKDIYTLKVSIPTVFVYCNR